MVSIHKESYITSQIFNILCNQDSITQEPNSILTSRQRTLYILRNYSEYSRKLFICYIGGGNRSRTDDPLRARQML